MNITKDIYQEIKDKLPIEQIIGEIIPLNKNLQGICPFHDDKNPSFTIYPGSQTFHCFGCDAHGDIFDFYERYFDISKAEALKRLADKAGVSLDNNNKPKLVCTYEYQDENGAPVYYIDRLLKESGEKIFRAWRVEDGKKVYNLDGVRRVLYRLPELIKGKGNDPVLIVEGEKDVETARSLGFIATTNPHGAGKWRDEHSICLKNWECVLIPDNDEPGMEHMRIVVDSLLKNGAKSIKIINLPGLKEKEDLTDFINKGGTREDILRLIEEIPEVTKTNGISENTVEQPIGPIHLVDIEKSEYTGKLISTDIMIAGIGESYLVPKKYTISCNGKGCEKIDNCKYYNEIVEIEIPNTNDEFLTFIKQTELQTHGTLKYFARLEKSCHVDIDIIEHIPVQVYIAIPKVELVQYDPKTEIIRDEKGRDYREKIIYHAGTVDQSNVYCKAIGKALPNPRNSEATLLVSKMVKLSNVFDEFNLTPSAKEQLTVFIPKERTLEGVKSKLSEIAKDISIHITKVTGPHKEHLHKGILLVYASPLYINFNGVLQNGVVNILIIGDTAQGKSTIAKRLQEAIGYGAYVHGSSSNRTGLLYSLDTKIDNARTLRWGIMAIMNRQLVIVDEAQKLGYEGWEEMSLARSEGVIRVNKSKKGEHPMFTRQIYIANPKDMLTNKDRAISECMYGIEAGKLMRSPDIRRFDFIMVVAIGDDDPKEVNKLYREQTYSAQTFTSSLLRTWIDWVWSKLYSKRDTIVWEEDSDKKVMEMADRLFKKYSCVDIPLVVEDIKDKIARLSVSMANITPFVIDNLVHVYPAHVEAVGDFLIANYDHRSNQLNEYARMKREQGSLSNEEYEKAKEDLEGQLGRDLPEFIKVFRENESISANEIGIFFGWVEKATVSNKIAPLRKYGFLTSSRSGYRKRPKFIEFIKRYDSL